MKSIGLLKENNTFHENTKKTLSETKKTQEIEQKNNKSLSKQIIYMIIQGKT